MTKILLQAVVDLEDQLISEMGIDGGFFLVGTHRVADLFLEDERVLTTLKFTQPRSVAMKNFVREEGRNSFAIILLKGNHDIQLTQENPYIDIQQNPKILSQIKEKIIDMVVVSKDTEFLPSEIYQEILPTVTAQEHSNIKISPISLNRCRVVSGTGTSLDKKATWWLGPLSPRYSNDCYRKLTYKIEDLVTEGMPEFMCFDIGDELEGVYECPEEPTCPAVEVAAHDHFINDHVIDADIVNVDIVYANQLNADIANIDVVNANEINAEIVNAAIFNVVDVVDRRGDGGGSGSESGGGDSGSCPNSNTGSEVEHDKERDLKDIFGKRKILEWQLEFYNGARAEAIVGDEAEGAADDENVHEYLYMGELFFDHSWQKLIADSNALPWRTIAKKENKWWIEYLYDNESPALSRLRCWLDFIFYDSLMLDTRVKTKFAHSEGRFLSNKVEMGKAINRHGDSHKPHLFIAFLLYKTKATSLAQFQKWLLDSHDELLEATDNLFLANYYCDRLGVSFKSSGFIIEMQRRTGSNMGHLFANHVASSQVTLFMYEIWHNEFVTFLKTENKDKPISVQVDESTIHHVNYIIVLLQGIYVHGPKTWFYRVLHNIDGSGEGIFNAIRDQWRADGLEDHFQRNLRGASMDGASSMGLRGVKRKGLFTFLQELADHPLIGTHCHAHRLSLAGKWSIKTEPFFIHIGEVIQRVYVFYGGKGYKRMEHLRETSKELGMYLYMPQKLYEIRWVDSERQAAKKLKKNWLILVKDLYQICWDTTEFDAPTRQQACGLAHDLSTRRFIVNLHFSLDILEYLSVWSLQLQRSNDLLFDKSRQRDELLIKLNAMKDMNGDELQSVLDNVRCWGETPQWVQIVNGLPQIVMTYEKTIGSPCNLNQLDLAEYSEWRGFPLLARSAGMDHLYTPKLSDIREEVLENLSHQIKAYFPHETFLHSVRIFDPREIPPNTALHSSYGQETSSDVQTVARILRYGELEGPFGQADNDYFEAISNEWQHLLSQFKSVSTFAKDRELPSDRFWTKYLGMPGFNIYPRLRNLIEICVSLPSGSSSVERAFSHLGRIRNKERSHLGLLVSNGLMFSKLNAPTFEHFRPRKFAKEWVKRHARPDDPTVKKGKRGKKDKQEEEEDRTLLGGNQFA